MRCTLEEIICAVVLFLFQLEDQLHNVLPRVPVPLQEAVLRLLSRDPRQRPTAQLLSLIKYFR